MVRLIFNILILCCTMMLAEGKRKCLRTRDQKFKYTQCDPRTNTTSVHFYYDDDCEDVVKPETSESS